VLTFPVSPPRHSKSLFHQLATRYEGFAKLCLPEGQMGRMAHDGLGLWVDP
jgi:hypothetical protein